jgi:hypothetical protein
MAEKYAKWGRMMGCLFCGFPEPGYRSGPDKEFTCSRCTQLLLSADQAELGRGYSKAIEKGYQNKAKAIESFLIPEENFNGQRKPVPKKRGRHTDRKRINRAIGDKKKRTGRS